MEDQFQHDPEVEAWFKSHRQVDTSTPEYREALDTAFKAAIERLRELRDTRQRLEQLNGVHALLAAKRAAFAQATELTTDEIKLRYREDLELYRREAMKLGEELKARSDKTREEIKQRNADAAAAEAQKPPKPTPEERQAAAAARKAEMDAVLAEGRRLLNAARAAVGLPPKVGPGDPNDRPNIPPRPNDDKKQ